MGSRDALSLGTKDRPPVLFPNEYSQWRARFLDFIESQDNGENIMESLLNGKMERITEVIEDATVFTDLKNYTPAQRDRFKGDQLAKTFVLQGIPNDIYDQIDSYSYSGKAMWDKLKELMTGSEVSEHLKITNLLSSYEDFRASEDETLEDTFRRFEKILNELNKVKMNRRPVENNMKFLSVLQPEWKRFSNPLKHNKDLGLIPLHVVYETLMQNIAEVTEKREKLKKTEEKGKAQMDPLALISDRRDSFNSNETFGCEGIKPGSEMVQSDHSDFERESEELMQNMMLMTKAFQQKFYNRPGTNNQRFTSGSRNFEHKRNFNNSFAGNQQTDGERKPEYQSGNYRGMEEKKFEHQGGIEAEGKRRMEPQGRGFGYGERRMEPQGRGVAFGERRVEPQGRGIVFAGERSIEKKDDTRKCYNCGMGGHFARECKKPVVRNVDYYKAKLALAEQKAAGTVLLAEDDYWLDASDDESNNVEYANMCLMGNTTDNEPSTSDSEVNFSSFDYDDYISRMNTMMLSLKENQQELKRQKENDLKNNQLIDKLRQKCAIEINFSKYIEQKDNDFEELRSTFQRHTDTLTDRVNSAERSKNVFIGKFNSANETRIKLEEKVSHLEKKLYARDQSEQTIQMNKPKEFRHVKSKWGIGYPNPQNLRKSINLVPTLYDFKFLDLGTRYPNLGLKWTNMSEVDREKEEKRKSESKKMKLPFCYAKINREYNNPDINQALSDDYFQSYSISELKAQTIEGKPYVPTLILESKIVQLQEEFESSQHMFDLERDFLMTFWLSHESESCSKLEDIPESNESTLSDSDVSSCKAFMGFSTLKGTFSDNESSLLAKFKTSKREPSASSSNDSTSIYCVENKFENFKKSLDFHPNSHSIDFNAALPNHSDFLVSDEIPKEYCKGESSHGCENGVPEISYYSKDKTQKKSRKRIKRKKSLKPLTHSSNFSNYHSSGSFSEFKREVKQEWRPKLTTFDGTLSKTSIPKSLRKNKINDVKKEPTFDLQKQSVVFPKKLYNVKQLMQFSHKLICCSYCGSDDFDNKRVLNNHYNHNHAYNLHNHHNHHAYSSTIQTLKQKQPPKFIWVPVTDFRANKTGPIFKWVPKSV